MSSQGNEEQRDGGGGRGNSFVKAEETDHSWP